MQNLYNDLKELLLQHGRYTIDGKLNKPKIEDDGLNLDANLLKLLLQNPKFKKHFFQDVDSIMVFDKVKFQRFINNKQFLPDCYTEFKNKIGLTIDGKFLTESKEVVLDFPYKDCVLQGCQDKENVKCDEVFFNETLAPDDIDMLLEPKVLTGFKRYDANGCHTVSDITMQDNLIIKGNNLLALHSLKQTYKGKIKLIYIDPPYNTGNDSFKYNDKFNHSTWLTFMKNRFEIARELLRDDGCIFVQIDHSANNTQQSSELGYLLVLMDQIFGRNNYISQIIWKKKGNASNTEANIGTITESILMYAKNFEQVGINLQDYKRIYKYEDHHGFYNLEQPIKTNDGEYKRNTMQFAIMTPEGTFYPPDGKRWTMGYDVATSYVSSGNYVIHANKFYIKKYASSYKSGEGKLFNNLFLDTGSLKSAKNELKNLGFNREGFSTPKPEELIYRIISMATKVEDIVLDYHLGSGTTAAVAHKMGRRYIGIEQMGYIEELSVTRLKKVIGNNKNNELKDYDTSGISKAVNWCGGGSFIYCELMQNNQIWVDKITNSNNTKELIQIWKFMQDKAQLSYKVDIKQINTNINQFELLALSEQKRFLLEVLDKNQLYVNYTEIDDIDYSVSNADKELNHKFYSMK